MRSKILETYEWMIAPARHGIEITDWRFQGAFLDLADQVEQDDDEWDALIADYQALVETNEKSIAELTEKLARISKGGKMTLYERLQLYFNTLRAETEAERDRSLPMADFLAWEVMQWENEWYAILQELEGLRDLSISQE